VSDTDPRPPNPSGAHSIYGAGSGKSGDRRKRWIFILGAVLVAALALWIVFMVTTPTQNAAGRGGGRHGGGARGGAHGGAGGPPTAVNAAAAALGDMPIYLNELGTVTPLATVTVVAQIAGQLQTVAFTEGQMVRKGQFLAQIDPRPTEQALLQAQGQLAKDQATLANDQINLKRYQTLLAQDSIARQQVDTQAATVRLDVGQVKADQAAVQAQKINLIYCHITAPVAGRVGLRQVDPGNYVTVGSSTGIVVITEINPMDVLFTVPEDNLDEVTARVHAGAVLAATAFDRSQTSQLASGHLLTLDNQVDTTTGTVRAKARFDNADGALFPNQFVNIRLTVDTLHNVIIVPTSAVLKGPQGMFAYVVQQDRTVAVTPVKVGPAAGDNTAILSGLQTGDVVVTDGSDRLKDGARVILPGDCIPARSGAGGAVKPAGGGFFGLFKKPVEDPMAAMRCKPGQHPSSLLSGGAASAFNLNFGAVKSAPAAGVSTTTTATTTTRTATSSHTTPISPAEPPPQASAPAPAPASPPTPAGGPRQGGESQGGEGRGHGGAGRLQAMIAALNLDAGQQQQAQAIFAAAGQQAQSTGDFRTAMQAAFAKLDAILHPDQKAKLQQLRAEAAARRAQREAAGGGSPDQ
jgi:multidrug efflux system membrane fusion protein